MKMDFRDAVQIAENLVRRRQHRIPDKPIVRWEPARRRLICLLPSPRTQRRQRAKMLHESILTLGTIASSVGAAQLWQLWRMYQSGLWMEFSPVNAEGRVLEYSFNEYVEDYLSDALGRSYQLDMARIVVEVFQRVSYGDYRLESGERITPELLLQKGGMARLKKATQKIRSNPNAPRALVEACVRGVAEKRDLDWFDEAAGINPRRLPVMLPNISYRLDKDGNWTAVVSGMTQEQYTLFQSLTSSYSSGHSFD